MTPLPPKILASSYSRWIALWIAVLGAIGAAVLAWRAIGTEKAKAAEVREAEKQAQQ